MKFATILKSVGAAVVIAAVFAVIVFGGWKLGWWFTNQNNNLQGRMIRNSYANQQTLRDQIRQKIGDTDSLTVQLAAPGLDPASTAAITAQRHAIIDVVCGDAAEVNTAADPLPAATQTFVNANCLDGNAR